MSEFKVKLKIIAPNGSEIVPKLNSKDCGTFKRPTKAIQETAVFLVEQLGVDPDAMLFALGKAWAEIARFALEEYHRKKKELMEKQKQLMGVENGAVR